MAQKKQTSSKTGCCGFFKKKRIVPILESLSQIDEALSNVNTYNSSPDNDAIYKCNLQEEIERYEWKKDIMHRKTRYNIPSNPTEEDLSIAIQQTQELRVTTSARQIIPRKTDQLHLNSCSMKNHIIDHAVECNYNVTAIEDIPFERIPMVLDKQDKKSFQGVSKLRNEINSELQKN